MSSVQVQICELQKQLDKLKAATNNGGTEIDWSTMINHLVYVSDTKDYNDWLGPFLLREYNPDQEYPFKITNNWRYAKPYQGPTKPNWIMHTNDCCPIDGDEWVIIYLRNGLMNMKKAKDFMWILSNKRNSPNDIIKYSIVKP